MPRRGHLKRRNPDRRITCGCCKRRLKLEAFQLDEIGESFLRRPLMYGFPGSADVCNACHTLLRPRVAAAIKPIVESVRKMQQLESLVSAS